MKRSRSCSAPGHAKAGPATGKTTGGRQETPCHRVGGDPEGHRSPGNDPLPPDSARKWQKSPGPAAPAMSPGGSAPDVAAPSSVSDRGSSMVQSVHDRLGLVAASIRVLLGASVCRGGTEDLL